MPTTTSQWYFLRDGQQVGPISSKALREMAAAGDIAPDDLIWKEGMAVWKPARHLKGLFPVKQTAAPPTPPPPLPPAAPLGSAAGREVSENSRIRAVGLAQKWLLWGVLAGIPAIFFWPLLFLAIPFQLYCFARLALAMRWSMALTILMALLAAVPYINMIVLLVLNQKTTKTLQAAGVPVRFMGPRSADLPQTEPQPLSSGTIVGLVAAVAAATCVVSFVVGVAVIFGTNEGGAKTQIPVANDQLPLQAEKNRSAARHVNRGLVLTRQGKLEEAIAAYHDAIELDPNHADAYVNLGIALDREGKLAEAIDAFRKAIAVNPRYAEAYNNLGLALDRTGDPAQAVEAYREAIELEPDFAKAYANLGIALLHQGNFAEATTACRKAIEFNPRNAAAYGILGVVLERQRKSSEAIDAYRKAIEFDPTLANTYIDLGRVLDLQGRPSEAVNAFRKAIKLQPGSARALCSLGLVLAEQGKYTEALAALKRGHEIGSKRPNWDLPSARWIRELEQSINIEEQ